MAIGLALNPLREEARKALLETNRSLVIKQIIDFIQDYPDGLYARYRAIQILGEIGSRYPELVQLLSDLLCNSQDQQTVVQTAETLAKIVPNHQEAITILLKLLEDEVRWLIDFLSITKNLTQMREVVSKLKPLLTHNQLRETDDGCWEACYHILCFCAQGLSYQNFYEVWNS